MARRSRSSSSGSWSSSGGRSSRGGSSFDLSRDDDRCDRYSDSLCDDDSLSLLFFYYTFGIPWSLPRLFDEPSLVGYARYPFADGPGLLRLAPASHPDDARES